MVRSTYQLLLLLPSSLWGEGFRERPTGAEKEAPIFFSFLVFIVPKGENFVDVLQRENISLLTLTYRSL